MLWSVSTLQKISADHLSAVTTGFVGCEDQASSFEDLLDNGQLSLSRQVPFQWGTSSIPKLQNELS
jgi:hypothetical protein